MSSLCIEEGEQCVQIESDLDITRRIKEHSDEKRSISKEHMCNTFQKCVLSPCYMPVKVALVMADLYCSI